MSKCHVVFRLIVYIIKTYVGNSVTSDVLLENETSCRKFGLKPFFMKHFHKKTSFLFLFLNLFDFFHQIMLETFKVTQIIEHTNLVNLGILIQLSQI